MRSLSREEHGELREGRISSTSAKLLRSGTKKAWERLASILDDPPPFTEATAGPMADGVRNEPLIARRFLNRHPEIQVLESPGVIYHHQKRYRFRDMIISSPDRMADGIPVEIKYATTNERFTKLTKPMANGFVPATHIDQVEWHAWMSGAGKCWFVVATDKKIDEVLYERKDLSHFDKLLDEFFRQYVARDIKGAR